MQRTRPLLIPRPVNVVEPADADLVPLSVDLYQAALEISNKRAEQLTALKAAILRRDTSEVYRLSSALCGLEVSHEEKRH